MAISGCVTETVPDEDPPPKHSQWPQQQKHGFFDFLHWGHSGPKTRTVIAQPFPPDQGSTQQAPARSSPIQGDSSELLPIQTQ